MSILTQCKTALRTTTTDENLVERISTLIDAAKEDLKLGGVDESWLPEAPTNPLIIQAIVSYVCWLYFNDIDISESEKWRNIYDMHVLKIQLRSQFTEAEDAES